MLGRLLPYKDGVQIPSKKGRDKKRRYERNSTKKKGKNPQREKSPERSPDLFKSFETASERRSKKIQREEKRLRRNEPRRTQKKERFMGEALDPRGKKKGDRKKKSWETFREKDLTRKEKCN